MSFNTKYSTIATKIHCTGLLYDGHMHTRIWWTRIWNVVSAPNLWLIALRAWDDENANLIPPAEFGAATGTAFATGISSFAGGCWRAFTGDDDSSRTLASTRSLCCLSATALAWARRSPVDGILLCCWFACVAENESVIVSSRNNDQRYTVEVWNCTISMPYSVTSVRVQCSLVSGAMIWIADSEMSVLAVLQLHRKYNDIDTSTIPPTLQIRVPVMMYRYGRTHNFLQY